MMTPVAVVAVTWVAVLLIGIVSWETSKKGRFRKTDLFVFAMSVTAAAAWMFLMMPRETAVAAATAASRKPIATCAIIAPGDSEAKVKEKLGDPDEIRSEEEVRGPASDVWIYRDSRCAVHFFGDIVESIE